MPELSFEDLLDDSPVKKSMGIVDDDDPLGLDDDNLQHTKNNETLNTPGPKKPPQQQQQHIKLAVTSATTTAPRTMASSVTENSIKRTTVNATNAIKNVTTTVAAAAVAPNLLNSKNLLPKSVSGAGGSQMMKMPTKSTVTGTAATTGTTISIAGATATTTMGGKTAIRTANGQILYIQKKPISAGAAGSGSGGGGATLSGSRLTISTQHNTATASAAGGGGGGNNKPVAIKLMRTSAGTLVPFKTNATTNNATATTATVLGAKKSLTLSPKVASKFGMTSAASLQSGQTRIISTAGGQVLIQTTTNRSTAGAATTTTTINPTATSTTTYRVQQAGSGVGGAGGSSAAATANANAKGAATAAGPHKIVVQTANGKQIVVSNQHLFKLSPKPPTSSSSSAAATSATNASGTSSVTARQMQTLQLPGKSVQYLRAATTTTSAAAAAAGHAATSSASVASSAGEQKAAVSSNATASTIKILNASGAPSKFTVVRPGATGTTKIILTQSPKKEGSGGVGVPVTFSPITSKVQKTIVTVPPLRPFSSDVQRNSNASNSNSTTALSQTASTSSGTNSGQLVSSNMSNSQTFTRNYTTSTANTNTNITTTTTINPLMRKHKISDLNSELKRITATLTTTASGSSTAASTTSTMDDGGPPELKKLAAGGRIVMLPRSMLHAPGGGQMRTVTVQTNAGSAVDAAGKNGRQSPTHKVTFHQLQQQQQQQQQMHVMYKSNNNNEISGQQKSLLVAGASGAGGSKMHALNAQQQQQQNQQPQQQMLKIKRELQVDQHQQHQHPQQQLDLRGATKLFMLATEAAMNSTTSNNNKNNSNSNKNDDMSLINLKIKLEPGLEDNTTQQQDIKPTIGDLLAADGGIRRKHCNCSKSQCLKLYCDCFANGEFCQDCTCKDCCNNLLYEDMRQRAIKNCLDRNPSAFKPKITTSQEQGDMRHNKGCNCKRSGCLKNYCECYEAKIPCSSNCKCIGCRNIEERPDLDMDPIDPKILATIANASLSVADAQKRSYDKANSNNTAGNDKFYYKDAAKALAIGSDLLAGLAGGSGSLVGSSCSGSNGGNAAAGASATATSSEKPQCNFITQEVVDATIQCMISQADECEKNGLPTYQTEKMVMEEMGRCLVEIIDFSIRNTDSSFAQD